MSAFQRVLALLCCSCFMLTACGSDTKSSAAVEPDSGNPESSVPEKEIEVDGKISDATVVQNTTKDNRTGKTITTVQFGGQVWMAENVTDNSYSSARSMCYDNESNNCDEYGRLFQPDFADYSCPSGFNMPSLSDWNTMATYAAQHPEALEAMHLTFGGACMTEKDSIACRGIGSFGLYLASDGIAVFKPNSAALSYEKLDSKNYYSLRCVNSTYIVGKPSDLPPCDTTFKKPFFVASEQTNYRCSNGRWVDDFSDDCGHVLDGTSAIFNDTMYVCRYRVWQVADIYEIADSCTVKTEAKTVLFNGIRYACENGSWRKFSAVENSIGYCRESNYKTIDSIKTLIDTLVTYEGYFCDTTGWRKALLTDYFGYCDSSRIYETVELRDTGFVCRGKSWTKFTELEEEIGVCTPQRQGRIDTTSSEATYICDSLKWRTTTMRDYTGDCDEKRIGTTARYDGYLYVCKDAGWFKLSALESELGLCGEVNEGVVKKTKSGSHYICKSLSWTSAGAVDVGGACTSSNQYKKIEVSGKGYYCRGNAWKQVTSIDSVLGLCTDKMLGKRDSIVKLLTSYYVCDSTGWYNLKGSEVRFGRCSSANNGVRKVVGDSAVADTAFICSNNTWATMSLELYRGKCDTTIWGKLVKYMGNVYGCHRTSWLTLDSIEQNHGICMKSNLLEMVEFEGKHYQCKSKSSTSYAWTEVSDLQWKLGKCTSSDSMKTLNGVKYKCSLNQWVEASLAEVNGSCTEKRAGEIIVFKGMQYYCDIFKAPGSTSTLGSDWTKFATIDSVKGPCTTKSVGDTLMYKNAPHVCQQTPKMSAAPYHVWTASTYKEYMSACDLKNDGKKMFNGFNTSQCLDEKWVGYITTTITDSRDHKTYKTQKVGKLTWMFDNLSYEASNSWCYSEKNGGCDVRLYSYSDAENICPAGWRLPTAAEWDSLRTTLYNVNETTDFYSGDWPSSVATGNDLYGLGLVPTGFYMTFMQNGSDPMGEVVKYRSEEAFGGPYYVNYGAYYWTSEGDVEAFGKEIQLKNTAQYQDSKVSGLAVRCVK